MENKIEEAHTGFLIQSMGKRSRKIVDRKWETPGAGVVWEEAGKQ